MIYPVSMLEFVAFLIVLAIVETVMSTYRENKIHRMYAAYHEATRENSPEAILAWLKKYEKTAPQYLLEEAWAIIDGREIVANMLKNSTMIR